MREFKISYGTQIEGSSHKRVLVVELQSIKKQERFIEELESGWTLSTGY